MILAVGEHVLGELDPRMVRISTPFGGGVAGTKEEMCGALSGGLMVIGALHGRVNLSDSEDEVRRMAVSYRERFAAAMGDTICGPIYEQYHSLDEAGLCAPVVERAAGMLLDLLDE